MREKDNFYFNRMLMKVLKEKGTGRYCWINVPRLLDEVKKYDCNGSLIQKKVELAEEDENTEVISQRTGINTMTAENPACVVAEGTGRYAEVMEELGK